VLNRFLLEVWFAICDVLYALAWVGAILLLIGLLLEVEWA